MRYKVGVMDILTMPIRKEGESMNTERIQTEENDEIDLLLLASDFLKTVRTYWKLVLFLLCIIFVGYTGYTYLTYSPLYQSEATFTVETSVSENGSYGFYYSSDTADQLSKTFPYILESNYFKSVLLQNLDTQTLNGTLSAETVSDSNMVTMRVESSNAEDAFNILNTALSIYPQTARFVLGETQFHIINEPVLATSPYNKPSILKTVGMGLLIGIAVPFVVVGLIAFFKKSARTLEQMNKITNLKCIAMLPKVTFKARRKKMRPTISITDRKVSFDYKENIRSMRIRLERLLEKENGKVVMVSSTISSEGKSTISVNLAESLVSTGKKVVLIDGDVRKPSLAKMLNVSDSLGLHELVQNKENLLNKITFLSDQFAFIGNHTAIKNPIEVLTDTNLENFMEELKKYFDVIIMDTAPAGIFQDAYEFQHVTDFILFVVKYDEVPLQKIQETLTGFHQDHRHMAYVFNEYTQTLNDYGYGKYRYGYYKYPKESVS